LSQFTLWGIAVLRAFIKLVKLVIITGIVVWAFDQIPDNSSDIDQKLARFSWMKTGPSFEEAVSAMCREEGSRPEDQYE